MGQVLKQDLAAGRLLELDDDLPELLLATDAAQRAIRDLLGSSSVASWSCGTDSYCSHARRPASSCRRASGHHRRGGVREHASCSVARIPGHPRGSPQRCEARSGITNLVRLWGDETHVRVSVTDDGSGFDWFGVDSNRHFGLQIMKERLEAAGGDMLIDSRLGSGTTIAASVPKDS